jgi:hypothetical protein
VPMVRSMSAGAPARDGDAFVARIDPTGKLAERRTIEGAGYDRRSTRSRWTATAMCWPWSRRTATLGAQDEGVRCRPISAASISAPPTPARSRSRPTARSPSAARRARAHRDPGQRDQRRPRRLRHADRFRLSGASTTYLGSAGRPGRQHRLHGQRPLCRRPHHRRSRARAAARPTASSRGSMPPPARSRTPASSASRCCAPSRSASPPIRAAPARSRRSASAAARSIRSLDKVTTQTTLRAGDIFSIGR